jgi:hypothetical protein
VGLGSPESKIRSAYLLSATFVGLVKVPLQGVSLPSYRVSPQVQRCKQVYLLRSVLYLQRLRLDGKNAVFRIAVCECAHTPERDLSLSGRQPHPFSGAMAAHWCQEIMSGSIATGTVDTSGGVVVGEAASVVRG